MGQRRKHSERPSRLWGRPFLFLEPIRNPRHDSSLAYNGNRGTTRVAGENNYSAPNGVRFRISVVNGNGKWRCAECGQDGITDHEYGYIAEAQATIRAREHSVLCPAGRGSETRDVAR